MDRRSAPWGLRILLVVTAVAAMAVPSSAVTASADTPEPVVTVNPFFPDERNVTECIGMLERPGCGSEARGGLHQNLVAIVMIGGLLLVFGRVAWGIRRSQQRHRTTTSS